MYVYADDHRGDHSDGPTLYLLAFADGYFDKTKVKRYKKTAAELSAIMEALLENDERGSPKYKYTNLVLMDPEVIRKVLVSLSFFVVALGTGVRVFSVEETNRFQKLPGSMKTYTAQYEARVHHSESDYTLVEHAPLVNTESMKKGLELAYNVVGLTCIGSATYHEATQADVMCEMASFVRSADSTLPATRLLKIDLHNLPAGKHEQDQTIQTVQKAISDARSGTILVVDTTFCTGGTEPISGIMVLARTLPLIVDALVESGVHFRLAIIGSRGRSGAIGVVTKPLVTALIGRVEGEPKEWTLMQPKRLVVLPVPKVTKDTLYVLTRSDDTSGEANKRSVRRDCGG
jgi:hypothetical protein